MIRGFPGRPPVVPVADDPAPPRLSRQKPAEHKVEKSRTSSSYRVLPASGMLLALPRGRPTALARRLNAPLPLRNLGSTSTTGSSHSFDPHDVPPAMAAPPSTEETPAQEGAKLRSRPAVQLKTPKGTRDLFGPSLLLREQILCVGPRRPWPARVCV